MARCLLWMQGWRSSKIEKGGYSVGVIAFFNFRWGGVIFIWVSCYRTYFKSTSKYVRLNIPKTQNCVLQLLDGSFEIRPEKLLKVY